MNRVKFGFKLPPSHNIMLASHSPVAQILISMLSICTLILQPKEYGGLNPRTHPIYFSSSDPPLVSCVRCLAYITRCTHVLNCAHTPQGAHVLNYAHTPQGAHVLNFEHTPQGAHVLNCAHTPQGAHVPNCAHTPQGAHELNCAHVCVLTLLQLCSRVLGTSALPLQPFDKCCSCSPVGWSQNSAQMSQSPQGAGAGGSRGSRGTCPPILPSLIYPASSNCEQPSLSPNITVKLIYFLNIEIYVLQLNILGNIYFNCWIIHGKKYKL